MTHLEQLIFEYYDWQEYIVKHNIKVGKRLKGGYEMELDIIAYNPKTNHLIHIEPSLDTDSWEIRTHRFKKKFEAGKKYILMDIFKWLKGDAKIEQLAIFVTHPKNKDIVAGGQIMSVDELMKQIKDAIEKHGRMGNKSIPEQYPLLRTVQLAIKGYYKCL